MKLKSNLATVTEPRTFTSNSSSGQRETNLVWLRSFYDIQIQLAIALLAYPQAIAAWLAEQPRPKDHVRIAKEEDVPRGLDRPRPDAFKYLDPLAEGLLESKEDFGVKGLRHHAELKAPAFVRLISWRVMAIGVLSPVNPTNNSSVLLPSIADTVCKLIEEEDDIKLIRQLIRQGQALRDKLIIENQNLVFREAQVLYKRISTLERETTELGDAISVGQEALLGCIDCWLPGMSRTAANGCDSSLSYMFKTWHRFIADEWRCMQFTIIEPRGHHNARAKLKEERQALNNERMRRSQLGEVFDEASDEDAAKSLINKGKMKESRAFELLTGPKVSNFTALEAASAKSNGDGESDPTEYLAEESLSAAQRLEQADNDRVGLELLQILRPTDALIVVGLNSPAHLAEAAVRWIRETKQDLLQSFAADVRAIQQGNVTLQFDGISIVQRDLDRQ
jgi:hypothetical protein